jgi:non-homologous end joining protein Ku
MSELKDEQTELLMKLVQKKKKAGRKAVIKVEEPERGKEEVVDLMEILKRSLAGKKKKVA